MKNYIIITVLALLCAAGRICAQDIVYFRDSTSVQAKVSEIGDDYVVYKTADNPEGPDYRISSDKVWKICFQNGTEKIFCVAEKKLPVPSIDGLFVPGQMYYRRGHYFMGPNIISSEDLIDYIGYTTYGSTYIRAKRNYTAGFFLTGLGAGITLIGAIMHLASASGPDFSGSSMMPSSSGEDYFFAGCYVVGAASLATGIPLLVKGNRQLRAIADDYNSRYGCATSQRETILTLGNCPNGIGIALHF